MKINRYYNLAADLTPIRKGCTLRKATKSKFDRCTIVHNGDTYKPIVMDDLIYIQTWWVRPRRFLELLDAALNAYRRNTMDYYMWDITPIKKEKMIMIGKEKYTRKDILEMKQALIDHCVARQLDL